MAVLSFTLGLLMIIAGVRQLLHPWDLQHHAFFNGAHPPSATGFPFWPCCAPHWGVCSYVWHSRAHRRACEEASDGHVCRAGALSDTWVSAGELLSGASYILTGCLFFKHFSLPNCRVTGVHSQNPSNTPCIGGVLGHATSCHDCDICTALRGMG